MSTQRAAASVFDVLLARTVGAIREITVERGLDPREFSLVAFGGAGPMLAPFLAREMELPEVVVPAAPAVFSAWGMLMSDLEYDLGRTVLTMLDEASLAQLEGVFAQLESEADQVLAAQSVPPALMRWRAVSVSVTPSTSRPGSAVCFLSTSEACWRRGWRSTVPPSSVNPPR